MPQRPQPLGQVQLEVLQYVEDHHPVPVSEVAAHFAKTAGKARTTILTVMERLREKGYLTRRKRGGTYHYAPRLPRNQVMASVVRRFIDESLGGSVSPLITYLSESGGVSDVELARLKELVASLESQREDKQS
jgi:predicted transcriptional regulator